jgi:hypothetical protein
MTQYLMSVWSGANEAIPGHESMPSEAEMTQIFADVNTFNEKLKASGNWVFAGGLVPASSATVVRSSAGAVTTTDGPFAETKEQLGGFWIVDAADLDVALALAAEGSVACRAAVEVRPFQCDPGA